MLVLGLIFTIVWVSIVPIHSSTVRSAHFTRSAVMVFLLCLIIGQPISLDSVELYHSVFNYSPITFIVDSLLYIVAILALVCFNTKFNDSIIKLPEYSLIIMFSVLGATIMISANDLISMYIALELQSFGLYLIACIRIDLTSSTHASLKYFLLGAISSAFILLGMSLIYQQMGTTNFESMNAYIETIQSNIENTDASSAFTSFMNDHLVLILGLISILCGCIFKISAAPFHSWFSDVIQGVPTYTGMIIINLPKISMFVFLFNFLHYTVDITQISSVQMFILVTTIFSLILGTVAGLIQTKIKRLLAFSTISHVGFLLIAIVVGSEAESSLTALIFYLTQYTLVTILAFLSLISYETGFLSFFTNEKWTRKGLVDNIADLQGVGQVYKVLTFTFVLCLFSIAGIPPLTGFYAQLEILNSSIFTNHPIIFLTAIVCSVISAAYYLKVIKVVIFDQVEVERSINPFSNNRGAEYADKQNVNSLQSYVIATLTAFITLFILDPKLLINSTELVALSVYLT